MIFQNLLQLSPFALSLACPELDEGSKGSVYRVGCATGVLLLLSACTTPPATETAASFPTPAVSGISAARPTSSVQPDSAPAPEPAVAPAVAAASQADSKNLLEGEIVKEFEQGKASWYGPRFNGRRTASGERYNMHALTAAHKTLPFGTVVRVRSLVNGKEVDVRITDRGPFSRGRVIDLSRAAAESIGMLGLGVKDVLLLVPESTPPMAATPPPLMKRSRPVRPALAPRPR